MAWFPNGLGAGTDNSVAGGAGGFMAYPQPPNPIGVGPEADGQFGPLHTTIFNLDGSLACIIQNPGRN